MVLQHNKLHVLHEICNRFNFYCASVFLTLATLGFIESQYTSMLLQQNSSQLMHIYACSIQKIKHTIEMSIHTLGLQNYGSVHTEEPLSWNASVTPDIITSRMHIWKSEMREGETARIHSWVQSYLSSITHCRIEVEQVCKRQHSIGDQCYLNGIILQQNNKWVLVWKAIHGVRLIII